jgi:hypothetical protein
MFFKQVHKCEPCSRNCAICPYVRNTHTFTNFEGKTFNVKNYINCTTANGVYANSLSIDLSSTVFRLSLGKNYRRKFFLKPQFHNHSRNGKWKKVFIKPPILAFRGDKNLKDILVHNKHNSMSFKQEHKCEPCSRNCAIFWLVINLTNVFGTGCPRFLRRQ